MLFFHFIHFHNGGKWENSCAVNFAYCQRRLHPGRTHRSGTGAAAAAAGGVVGEGQTWLVTGLGLPRPTADPLDHAHCLPGCGAPRSPHRACTAHFACPTHLTRTTHCTPSRVVAVVSPAQLPFHSSFLEGSSRRKGRRRRRRSSSLNLEQLKKSTRATNAKAAKKFTPPPVAPF